MSERLLSSELLLPSSWLDSGLLPDLGLCTCGNLLAGLSSRLAGPSLCLSSGLLAGLGLNGGLLANLSLGLLPGLLPNERLLPSRRGLLRSDCPIANGHLLPGLLLLG